MATSALTLLDAVEVLPPELLYPIFALLPTQHLKILRLASKRICKIATPALFHSIDITVQNDATRANLDHILNHNELGALVQNVTVIWSFDPTYPISPPSHELLRSGAERIAALPNLDRVYFGGSWPQGSREQFIERILPSIWYCEVACTEYEFDHGKKDVVKVHARPSQTSKPEKLVPRRTGFLPLKPTIISHGIITDAWHPLNLTELIFENLAVDAKYLQMLIMSQAHPKPPLKKLHLINCVLAFRAQERAYTLAWHTELFTCPFIVLFDSIKYLDNRKVGPLPEFFFQNITKLGWDGSINTSNQEILDWLRDCKTPDICTKWVEHKLAHVCLPRDKYIVEPTERRVLTEDVVAVLKFKQKLVGEVGPRRRWVLQNLRDDRYRASAYKTGVEGVMPHVKTPWILIKEVREEEEARDD